MADDDATPRSGENPPWEVDSGWHQARREAFVLYRDMPERSIRAVARALGKSSTLVGRWSSQDGWPERVAAWEGECDRRAREEFHDAAADVARAQAEDAAELRSVLMAPGRALAARVDRLRAEGRADPFQDIPLAELARLAVAAARVYAPVAQAERVALGLSGSEGGDMIERDIARKTTAELEEYLIGRAKARDERTADENAGHAADGAAPH